jgi:hypothetical protein
VAKEATRQRTVGTAMMRATKAMATPRMQVRLLPIME